MSDIQDIQDLVLQSLDAQLQRVNQINMSEINKLHSVASNDSLRADAERLRSQVSELEKQLRASNTQLAEERARSASTEQLLNDAMRLNDTHTTSELEKQVHTSKLQLEEERVRSASTEQLLKRQLDMAKEDLKRAYLNIETLKKQLDSAKEENLIGYSHIAAGVSLNNQSEAPDVSIFVPSAAVAELVTTLNVHQSQAPDDPRSTHHVTRLPVEDQCKRPEIVPAVVRASPQSKVREAKEKTMDFTSSKAIPSNHRTEFAPRHTGTSNTQHSPTTTSPANSSSANRPQKVLPLLLNTTSCCIPAHLPSTLYCAHAEFRLTLAKLSLAPPPCVCVCVRDTRTCTHARARTHTHTHTHTLHTHTPHTHTHTIHIKALQKRTLSLFSPFPPLRLLSLSMYDV
jgi:hypothetical protein